MCLLCSRQLHKAEIQVLQSELASLKAELAELRALVPPAKASASPESCSAEVDLVESTSTKNKIKALQKDVTAIKTKLSGDPSSTRQLAEGSLTTSQPNRVPHSAASKSKGIII